MTARTLVLVEPGVARHGGHHHRTLIALAEAHAPTVVVALHGITGDTMHALARAGARVSVRPAGLRAWLWWNVGLAVAGAAQVALWLWSSRRWPLGLRRVPYQLVILSRCLVEAASVHTGRHANTGRAAIVLLSASGSLHALAGRLAGYHVRVVHEPSTSEDTPLQLLLRLAGRGLSHVVTLAPTAAIRAELRARYPGLDCRVRPYAVASHRDRLTDTERDTARRTFGISPGCVSIALVGGWWPYKDINIIDTAATSFDMHLHVLVAGEPIDPVVINRWNQHPSLTVHHRLGPTGEAELRALYAAADAVLVAREPGISKESGLIVDAVRLGVPLVTSDHDPALNTLLAGEPWAATFTTGDADSLRAVLTQFGHHRLPRPDPGVPARLGIPTPTEQATFYLDLTDHKGASTCSALT